MSNVEHMTPIERLKELKASCDEYIQQNGVHHPDLHVRLLQVASALLPELLSLWESDNMLQKEHDRKGGSRPQVTADIHRIRKAALKALNAKAKEMLG